MTNAVCQSGSCRVNSILFFYIFIIFQGWFSSVVLTDFHYFESGYYCYNFFKFILLILPISTLFVDLIKSSLIFRLNARQWKLLKQFFNTYCRCYIQGADFNPLGIFPPVEYPVPRGTDMISPAIKWDHSQSWYVPDTNQFLSGCSDRQSETRFEFDASKNEHDKFLLGHKINGKVLFPAAGYMVLAWKALAKFHGKLFDRMPMVIENLKIHRATIIPPTG